MKKRVVFVAAASVCVLIFVLIMRDLSLKRSARSEILDLCINSENMGAPQVEYTTERLERWTHRILFLNKENERQAAICARVFISVLMADKAKVDSVYEQMMEADKEYGKQLLREDFDKKETASAKSKHDKSLECVDKAWVDLARNRREFSDKMRTVLLSYR